MQPCAHRPGEWWACLNVPGALWSNMGAALRVELNLAGKQPELGCQLFRELLGMPAAQRSDTLDTLWEGEISHLQTPAS